jgi:hypothetical protein
MGRPIQKRKIGNTAGHIAVTNVKWADGSTQADNENGIRVFIKKQKSTKRFLIETSDYVAGSSGKSEICSIISKSPALGVSQFSIAVEVGDLIGGSDGSTIWFVRKLKNRTVDVAVDAVSTTVKTLKYTLQTEETDEEDLTGQGIANIDVL